MQSLSSSLEENKAYFQGRFAHSMDFITREFTLAGRKAALFAVDGLINKEIIALSVMEPLLKPQDYPPAPQAMLAHIERAVLSAADSTRWAAGCSQPRGTPSAGRSSHQQGSASARQSPPAASAADFWML